MLLSGKFSVTDTRLYLPNVTSLTQDNAKLLNRLKSGFKGTVNWNKYQSKAAIQTQNQYLHYLSEPSKPSFHGVNRLFVLSFENNAHHRSYAQYFLPTVEIKYYNVMVD